MIKGFWTLLWTHTNCKLLFGSIVASWFTSTGSACSRLPAERYHPVEGFAKVLGQERITAMAPKERIVKIRILVEF